jgi:2-dehydro-3-deoxyphosphogluconate aldolase/(4S)-4-hydroxy-2-oxoglutarate aldolase
VGAHTDEVTDALRRRRLVAIVRTRAASGLLDAFAALLEGGIDIVEVTTTVPGALQLLERAHRRFGSSLELGIGTVLEVSTAVAAIDSGARFVVSPVFDEEVVAACAARDTLAIPGVLTPTEIHRAVRAGARVVKLFPGRVATPGYVRDILGPLPHVLVMPTGNVDLETAPRYLEAGAIAVGVGRAVLDPVAVAGGDFAAITAAARAFRRAVDGPPDESA